MLQLILFLVFSAALLLYSLPSLKDPHSHGFWRFFAWEAILALILLNAPAWFLRPFSLAQIISWILLCGSILLAIHGFWLLRVAGKPQGALESTTKLIRVGAYRFIRHPLYTSLLLLSWGAFCKDTSVWAFLLALLASLFLVLTARTEEAEMLARFGYEYHEYIKATSRFIPHIY